MNITEKDLEKFIHLACNCFKVLAPRLNSLVPLEPMIELNFSRHLDYSGLITLSQSGTHGRICLTLPTDLLHQVLSDLGETEKTEETLLDLVGEITSIISNNAREHFGSNFNISVPTTYSASRGDMPLLPSLCFVLPLAQSLLTAYLVISIDPN